MQNKTFPQQPTLDHILEWTTTFPSSTFISIRKYHNAAQNFISIQNNAATSVAWTPAG